MGAFDVLVLEAGKFTKQVVKGTDGFFAANKVHTLIIRASSVTLPLCARLTHGHFQCTDGERRTATGALAPGEGPNGPFSCGFYISDEVLKKMVRSDLICSRNMKPSMHFGAATTVQSALAGDSKTTERALPILLPLLDSPARKVTEKATWAPYCYQYGEYVDDPRFDRDWPVLETLRAQGVDSATDLFSLQNDLYAQVTKAAGEGGIDGSTAKTNRAMWLQYVLERYSEAETMCETGFNWGASTLASMVVNPTMKVYSFDLLHDDADPNDIKNIGRSFIDKVFPGRLTLTGGDSRETLPKFHRDHPDVTCDIIFVDGGHQGDVPTKDFAAMVAMASPNAIMIADDYGLGGVSSGMQSQAHAVDWQECMVIRDWGDEPFKSKSFCFGRVRPKAERGTPYTVPFVHQPLPKVGQ